MTSSEAPVSLCVKWQVRMRWWVHTEGASKERAIAHTIARRRRRVDPAVNEKRTPPNTQHATRTHATHAQGQEYAVHLSPDDTVASVKHKLEQQTQVSAKRQKLLGLKTRDGKLAPDDALVSDLALKAATKVMMMGQREAAIAEADAAAMAAPEVQDDFDLGPEEEQALEVRDRPEVMEKLQRRIRSVEVKVLSPPRPGKKCLVVSVD